MAKKNIVHISEAWNAEVKSKSTGKSQITFTGKNSKGTEVKVTIDTEDYFLKYICRDIMDVAKQRCKTATEFYNAINDHTI